MILYRKIDLEKSIFFFKNWYYHYLSPFKSHDF